MPGGVGSLLCNWVCLLIAMLGSLESAETLLIPAYVLEWFCRLLPNEAVKQSATSIVMFAEDLHATDSAVARVALKLTQSRLHLLAEVDTTKPRLASCLLFSRFQFQSNPSWAGYESALAGLATGTARENAPMPKFDRIVCRKTNPARLRTPRVNPASRVPARDLVGGASVSQLKQCCLCSCGEERSVSG